MLIKLDRFFITKGVANLSHFKNYNEGIKEIVLGITLIDFLVER